MWRLLNLSSGAWQGIVFDNQTFEDELDFDISDIESIIQ